MERYARSAFDQQIYDNDGYLNNYVGAPEEFFYGDDQGYYSDPYMGVPHESYEFGDTQHTFDYSNFS